MKRIIGIIVFGFIVVSCNLNYHSENVEKEKFNIKEDIVHFSSSMNNGDTIHLFANLSICCTFHMEHNLITKQNDSIYIEGNAGGFVIENWEKELPKVVYEISETDSMSLEKMFSYLISRNTQPNSIYAKTFKIVYEKDTVIIYSNGLGEQVPTVEYYSKIKRQLYPNMEIYKIYEDSIKPPPPPPPPMNTENLD